jgi:hypothetical protein
MLRRLGLNARLHIVMVRSQSEGLKGPLHPTLNLAWKHSTVSNFNGVEQFTLRHARKRAQVELRSQFTGSRRRLELEPRVAE